MLEVVTVVLYYLGSACSKCANTNSKTSEETPELLKLTERWSSCAPIVRKRTLLGGGGHAKVIFPDFSLDSTFPRTSRHVFSWRDQDSTQGNLNAVQWIERERVRQSFLCDNPHIQWENPSVSKLSVSLGNFLIDSVDIIISAVFCSLQVAETWMEFLMDFYSRNRCVAKANRGVPLGDVFIKPPIDPGWFFSPALKKSLLFKTE